MGPIARPSLAFSDEVSYRLGLSLVVAVEPKRDITRVCGAGARSRPKTAEHRPPVDGAVDPVVGVSSGLALASACGRLRQARAPRAGGEGDAGGRLPWCGASLGGAPRGLRPRST